MRHALILAAVVTVALFASAAASPAHAQCATGCSSSTSCNGSGKSSCAIACEGYLCNCTDTGCGTQLRPSIMGQRDQPTIRLADDAPSTEARTAQLLVDCRGNILDVRLTGPEGQAGLGELPSIEILSPRTPAAARMAIRH